MRYVSIVSDLFSYLSVNYLFCLRRILLLQEITEKLEKRLCVKFCFKLEKGFAESIKIHTYGSKMAAHVLIATQGVSGAR